MDGHPDSSSNLHQEETGDSRRRRKIKKHFVEKRRRCRINLLLEQMKSLVLTAMEKNPQQYEKMEKVDILELTVGYLRELRRLHMNRLPLLPLQQQQQQQHPHHLQQHQYRDGYLSAMSEVRDLLTRQHGMTEVSNRLTAHLHGALLRNGDRPTTASTAAAVPVAHQAGIQGQSRMPSTLSTAGSSVPDTLHLAARLQHHHPPAATSSPALFPLSLQFFPSQDQQQTTAPSSTRGRGGLLMTSSARNGGEGLLMTSRAASSHFLSPPYTNPQPRRHGNNQQTLLSNDNVVHSASEDISLRGVKAKVTDSLSPSIVTCISASDVSLSDDSSSSSSSDGKIQLSPQFVWRPF